MPRIRFESHLRHPVATVFEWHTRPGAFERLAPPWSTLRVRERTGTISDGGEVVVDLERGPLRFAWRFRHKDFEAGKTFTDEQVSGPFERWVHVHRFESDGSGGTRLVDEIEWEPPLSGTEMLATPMVEAELARVFAFRERRLANDLKQHARWAAKPRLAVALTGSSGMIGTALRHFLTTGGHRVVRIVRGAAGDAADPDVVRWDPDRGELAAGALAGVDAVVHLAGEPIVQLPRWTADKKKKILDSRVKGTELIARTVAEQHQGGPRVLVSMSGAGYYGDRKDEVLTEQSSMGRGFLAEVCKVWEESTRRARGAGVRVVALRSGPVLSPAGGMLEKVLIPFKMGMGGRVGSGRQYLPWIDLDDMMGVVLHVLMDERLSGPVNVCAPNPVPNATFADALGRVLERPTLVPVPAFVVKAGLGEMGEEALLYGQRTKPARLLETGYAFLFEGVEESLRFQLGRTAP